MSAQVEQSNGTRGTETELAAVALPAVSAIFVVKFDDRKGYTLAWQRSVENLNLDDAVEYKSMPSGLHNVNEDLVYFVYDDYAGVSAVLNIEDQKAARKSRVLAVGVLIPLEHGRMGRSWLHADSLRELVKKQIHKEDDYSLVEEFWNEHKLVLSPSPLEESQESPRKEELTIDTSISSKHEGYRLSRAMSAGLVPPTSDYTLPPHHPARVLPEFLRLLGPLVFPLVRAALLRKRILFLGEAPVERTCDYVYNLSILSSLPKPIASLIPDLDPVNLRLRPLFNIGVSDISYLESESKTPGGWIACTTDDVICTKPDLFDLLVILPGATSQHANLRAYPKIFSSSPELSKARPKYGIRASPRDAKRFATLTSGLRSIPRSNRDSRRMTDSSAIASSSESSPGIETRMDPPDNASIISTASSTISLKAVVEPQSWSRIAYTSLVWWASAGDKRSGLTEMEENENEQDVALLTGENLDEGEDGVDPEARTREVACVQYFQRLTNMIFTAASEAIRRHNGYEDRYEDENEGANEVTRDSQSVDEEDRGLLSRTPEENTKDGKDGVAITEEDIKDMGLDVWSQSDREFIEELIKFWWERKADVQSGRIDCCGLRLL